MYHMCDVYVVPTEPFPCRRLFVYPCKLDKTLREQLETTESSRDIRMYVLAGSSADKTVQYVYPRTFKCLRVCSLGALA